MKKKTSQYTTLSKIMTVLFTALTLFWTMPIIQVVYNSIKADSAIKLDAFALPTSETFVGLANYIKGMTFGNYPFLKSAFFSLFITVVSVALILLLLLLKAR